MDAVGIIKMGKKGNSWRLDRKDQAAVCPQEQQKISENRVGCLDPISQFLFIMFKVMIIAFWLAGREGVNAEVTLEFNYISGRENSLFNVDFLCEMPPVIYYLL